MTLRIEIITATVLLAALLAFGAGWSWRGSRCEAATATAALKRQNDEAAATGTAIRLSDSIGTGLELELAAADQTIHELELSLRHEIETAPDPDGCRAASYSVQPWIDGIAARPRSGTR
ncbi:MAG: hypothetical protein AB7F35_20245 [Acetobacteraceae bacterium]